MDINGVQTELRLHDEQFANWLKVKTDSGKTILKKKQWSHEPSVLKRRTSQIAALRKCLSPKKNEVLGQMFENVAASEQKAKEVLNSDEGGFAEECYGQLLFRHDLLKPINYIPFFLIVLRFWKIYIQPASAILMPISAIVLPYILIRYFFGIPMPISAYITIIKEFYSGNGFQGLMPTPELGGQLAKVTSQKAPQDFIGKIKFYAQTGWLIFSFIQSLWQPIQAAQHLAVLDGTLCEQGSSIRKIFGAATTIREIYMEMGIKVPRLPIDESEVADDRMAVATCLDSPARFKLLLELVGEWEVFYRFASHNDICLVNWKIDTEKSMIKLINTFDIHINPDNRIPFSVQLGTIKHSQHALLTGPNRGGKSTALRSIGRSVYLAHNFGVAIGVAAIMSPLAYMQTCLRLEDIPGDSSLFEREVAVASLALARADDPVRPGLLLIDELFHSTNPPDAEIASRIFLEKLWKSNNTISVISTHMFQLLDEKHNIQHLCCPATLNPDNSVKYHYGLAKGICKVSSVREILREGIPGLC